jgi:hypothetical protein
MIKTPSQVIIRYLNKSRSPKDVDIWTVPDVDDFTDEFDKMLVEIKEQFDLETDEVEKTRNIK